MPARRGILRLLRARQWFAASWYLRKFGLLLSLGCELRRGFCVALMPDEKDEADTDRDRRCGQDRAADEHQQHEMVVSTHTSSNRFVEHHEKKQGRQIDHRAHEQPPRAALAAPDHQRNAED